MNKKSLLQLAQSIDPNLRGRKTKITSEEIELALAWLRGEVTLSQSMKALKTTSGGIIAKFAYCLREAYRQDMLTINNKEEA